MQAAHCMPNPRVSLRHDRLIPVNMAVNEKEQLEKGLEEEEKKSPVEKSFILIGYFRIKSVYNKCFYIPGES
jgi:hypothetical protein